MVRGASSGNDADDYAADATDEDAQDDEQDDEQDDATDEEEWIPRQRGYDAGDTYGSKGYGPEEWDDYLADNNMDPTGTD